MAHDEDKTTKALTETSGAIAPSVRRPSLLQVPVTDLSPQEKRELNQRILNEQISLDVKAEEAEKRFVNSSRDMARDVQFVRTLEDTTRGDYSVDARYETASGQTNVRIRRNTNTVYMVIAIVIGILVLWFLNR